MTDNVKFDESSRRWNATQYLQSVTLPDVLIDDEGLFARNVDGQLIRVEKATAQELDVDVKLTINGREVTVKQAVPRRDAQGNIQRDAAGNPIPRPTTIYDAATEAFVHEPGQPHPIPTLCHQEHLPPVGACRVCMVEATEMSRRGARTKLVPSCVQRISEGMIVHSVSSEADTEAAARVQRTTSVIVELLLSDHAPGAVSSSTSSPAAGSLFQTWVPDELLGNQLLAVADRLRVGHARFASRTTSRGQDKSSSMIVVNHDECILCGRCERGCNWIKRNNVIGRSGKGYEAKISFDLNDPMGKSSCVSCGECAVSCPTGALTFQPAFIDTQIKRLRDEIREESKDGEIVTADELLKYPLFSGIPYKFLQFNGAAVIRRFLEPGDVLCREGEYGSTAFVILKGEFEIFISSTPGAVRSRPADGIWGWLGGLRTVAEKIGGIAKLADVGGASIAPGAKLLVSAEDVILGEMTCMNRYPRSATVVATQASEVLEIKRNVLYMLQRNATSRKILDQVYRARSLRGQLRSLPIFSSLDDDTKKKVAEFLKDRAQLISVDPGQTIFNQGDRAEHYYLVRLGFVKVSQRYGLSERVLNYLSPGTAFGEIGLLEDVGRLMEQEMGSGVQPGYRTATCTALDNVELVQIRGKDFLYLLEKLPEVKATLRTHVIDVLRRDRDAQRRLDQTDSENFVDQGLYNAQSLLVLDLERCTRCDECTKACADTHDGVTRLIRDGLRFDKFLVASSCRSCMDPYCLVGCPVDAIHRNGNSLEIAIEDYCIGCGLCAQNCPYGNINMHGFPKQEVDEKGRLRTVYQQRSSGKRKPVVQQRATTCDLCQSLDGKPSCVYACPHEAAFRMTGQQLFELTTPRPADGKN